MKVLVSEKIHPSGMEILKNAGFEIITLKERDQNELAEKLKTADALLVRIMDVTADMLAASPDLKLISKHGVGMDNIDMAAAEKQGIAVTCTLSANSQSVAEHTWAMILALARNLTISANMYKEIGFAAKAQSPLGAEVYGKTLGIIGLGRIGKRVAKVGSYGFDMKVLVYDPYLDPKDLPEGCELVTEKDRIFAESDFITLHCPANEETHHMVSTHEFSLMKPEARLVNCARGPVVDEQAMIKALQDRTFFAAGLDVSESEPCPADSYLLNSPYVILTPHFGGSSVEAATRVSTTAAQNIVDFFNGKEIEGRLI